MTDDSITEMILRIQQGETGLEEALWHSIEKLVQWYARKYYSRLTVGGPAPNGVELEDLYQTGYLAMVDAVKVYDPQLGAFSTILLVYLRKHFRQAIGRSDKQLYDPLNRALSLDAPLLDEDPETGTLADIIPDPHDDFENATERLFIEELSQALEQAIESLQSEKEKMVLREMYWQNRTQTDIAAEMNVSPNRVSQLHNKAIRRIRRSKAGKDLEGILDEMTPFYLAVGSKRFNSTHTSATEELVLRRERLRQMLDNYLAESSQEEG